MFAGAAVVADVGAGADVRPTFPDALAVGLAVPGAGAPWLAASEVPTGWFVALGGAVCADWAAVACSDGGAGNVVPEAAAPAWL